MDEKEKDLDIPEDIIDDDKIDLKEEDEVVSEDVLEENKLPDDDNHSDPEADDISTDEDIEPEPNINYSKIDKEKTIGEAIDESEQGSDAFKPDPEVDAAVDDIVRTESDEAIAEADAKIAAINEKKTKKSFGHKIKNGFVAWWVNPPTRYGTISALVLLFFIITLLPASRYTALNLFGVRVSSSLVVVDSQTRLPLKNINVKLQDKIGTTNEEGEISFEELKLGKSDLVIYKRGYADINEQIVLGWGSNPLGEQGIVATGEQFTFVLSDWKSSAPITEAEATSGENSAQADDTGKIVLTIGEEDISNIEVVISAPNYRDEKLSSSEINSDSTEVKLVPAKKHVFVSNRNGNYDLYTIDVDGQNEKIILPATGKEREVPIVNPHDTKDIIAYTSSREGEQNEDGFILDGLFIVDSKTGEEKRIARSEQLQVIGWSGDRLVYLQVVEGTSRGNDERSKLISYNLVTGEKDELASANYFNDVELVSDTVYYAVSSFAVPESKAKIYTVNVDGKNNENLIDLQVWNIFRTSYEKLLFSAVDQKWFSRTGEDPVEEISQQSSPQSLHFVDSPDGRRTVWVEIRDGKGVLLKSSTEEFNEEQVVSMPGLFDVMYWADSSTVVFRVISTDETADYVINLDGGEVQKITDVTATRNAYF